MKVLIVARSLGEGRPNRFGVAIARSSSLGLSLHLARFLDLLILIWQTHLPAGIGLDLHFWCPDYGMRDLHVVLGIDSILVVDPYGCVAIM